MEDVVLERVERGSAIDSGSHSAAGTKTFDKYSFKSFQVIDGGASLEVDLESYDLFDRYSRLKGRITHLNLTYEHSIGLQSLAGFSALSTLTLQPAAQRIMNIRFLPDSWLDQLEAVLIVDKQPIKTIHFVERRPTPLMPPAYSAQQSCLAKQSFRLMMDILMIEWDLKYEDGTVVALID